MVTWTHYPKDIDLNLFEVRPMVHRLIITNHNVKRSRKYKTKSLNHEINVKVTYIYIGVIHCKILTHDPKLLCLYITLSLRYKAKSLNHENRSQ